MSTYTWIKLYSEILDDPKMGRLPDHLWRRTVEIFLIAGRAGLEGLLPSVDSMAWTLRTTAEEITETLEALEKIHVVTRLPDNLWDVTNFTKRQAAMSDKERQQRHRAGVTNMSQSRHETVTEEEVEEEVDKKKNRRDKYISDPVILFMQQIGMNPNSNTPQILSSWRKAGHPDEWIIKALEKSKGKSQNYADKILLGWEADGYPKSRDEQIRERKNIAPAQQYTSM